MADDGATPKPFAEDPIIKEAGGRLTALAPAKINLNLHLCGQRHDGYHLLDSLVVFPRIGDHLGVEASDKIELSVSGPFGDAVPDGDDNLITRAARALAGNIPGRGAKIWLDKNLPVASGIGGGSSDCAAAIKLLCRLWDVEPPQDRGLSLGADVPVCCAAPKPQRMRGIGERLETVGTIPSAWIVLANPGVSVPTGAVFDAVADKSPPPGPNIPREGFTSFANLIAFLSVCRNDLQAAAVKICPAINTVLDALSGAPLVRMSGSGATCFALYPDQAAAEDKAAALHRSTDWWISSGAIQ